LGGRHRVGPFTASFGHPVHDVDVQWIEVQHPVQLRDIDVFGGQTAAQHIIRIGHDLHAGTRQVRVQVPGRQVQSLARFEDDPIHQQ